MRPAVRRKWLIFKKVVELNKLKNMGDSLRKNPDAEPKFSRKIEHEGLEAVLRYAEEKDIDGILEIIQKYYDDRKKQGDKDRDVEKFDRDQWTRALAGEDPSVALVIESGGKVCGDILVEKAKGPVSVHAPYWISIINVAFEFEGKGFAGALVESAVSETRKAFNAESIGLCVTEGNLRAVKLYERLGFTRAEGKEQDDTWHGKPSKSVCMVKSLDDQE
jgi:ribosomal protein S18 acetylase RimI-like enzyme